MDALTDAFFSTTTRDDGTRSLAPADWRVFAARVATLHAGDRDGTLRELATLALFCEQRGEPVATAALCRLAAGLDQRFPDLWRAAHTDADADQERRARALRDFVAGRRARRGAQA